MHFSRFSKGFWLALVALLPLAQAASPVPTLGKPAEYPAWWFERDVIPRLPSATVPPLPSPLTWPTHYVLADDYAVANIGQVKLVAIKAAEEMTARLPTGPGSAVAGLLAGWNTSSNRDDYAAINLGQLKSVATPFYDRLYDIGFRLPSNQRYPWSSSFASPDDYALANLGQIKAVFAFSVPLTVPALGLMDNDSDGLHDPWEQWYFGNTSTATSTSNSDTDFLTDLEEYGFGTRPDVACLPSGLVIFTP